MFLGAAHLFGCWGRLLTSGVGGGEEAGWGGLGLAAFHAFVIVPGRARQFREEFLSNPPRWGLGVATALGSPFQSSRNGAP